MKTKIILAYPIILSVLLFLSTNVVSARPVSPAKLYSMSGNSIVGTTGFLSNCIVTDNLLLTKNKTEYSENVEDGTTSQENSFYYSPWNSDVESIIESKLGDLIDSNPSAKILVINIGLSDRDILGYNEYSRIKSIEDIGIDPIDLNLRNRANDLNNERVNNWGKWRVSKIAILLKDVVAFAKTKRPDMKVFALGNADYYIRQDSHALREASDWVKWLKDGIVDGVLVKGHWTGRYNDAQVLSKLYKQLFPGGSSPKYKVIPISGGKNFVQDSTYARDWAFLQAYLPDIDTLVCEVRDEADEKAIKDFQRGNVLLSTIDPPQVGALMPTVLLYQENHGVFSFSSELPAHSLALLLVPRVDQLSSSSRKAIADIGVQLAKKNIELRYVEQGVGRGDSGEWRLNDTNYDLLAHFPTELTLIQTDTAGFIRSMETVKEENLIKLSSLEGIEPLVKVGQKAPDFALPDMNGIVRHLSDLRGKKNLLLTFFPKCFTGGCSNHLSSLRDRKSDFDAASTDIWAVSVDSGDVQIAFSKQWKFNFPLIPDSGRNLCLLFGAAQNTEQLAERMSVFIDKDGIIKWIDKDVHVTTHGADVLARIDQ